MKGGIDLGKIKKNLLHIAFMCAGLRIARQ